ncbi:MAG: response regulator transcription factor [Myxococcota bacterium]
MRVLVVEDDESVASALVTGLRNAGFEVARSADGLRALSDASEGVFDAVILDLMLPDVSGFDVLKKLPSIPVLVLSARPELDARLRSFALGAVDFVQKPFWMDELVARLRRHIPKGAADLVVKEHDVEIDGAAIGLTAAELAIFRALFERPGRSLRRDQLAAIALDDSEVSPRTIDSHIARIRRKLGRFGPRVKTIWGIGYSFGAS